MPAGGLGGAFVILLDTHIWIWWVEGSTRLSEFHVRQLLKYRDADLGVRIISCWEVARLVAAGKVSLSCPLDDWINLALR